MVIAKVNLVICRLVNIFTRGSATVCLINYLNLETYLLKTLKYMKFKIFYTKLCSTLFFFFFLLTEILLLKNRQHPMTSVKLNFLFFIQIDLMLIHLYIKAFLLFFTGFFSFLCTTNCSYYFFQQGLGSDKHHCLSCGTGVFNWHVNGYVNS